MSCFVRKDPHGPQETPAAVSIRDNYREYETHECTGFSSTKHEITEDRNDGKRGKWLTPCEHHRCQRGDTIASYDDTIVAAVEKVVPSVVNVSDVKLIQDAYLQVHPVQGVGSGIVIRQDGYIMTNSHVVLGSQEIQVTLQDGRTSRAQVRGIDTKTDIAVIHVEYEDLPVPEMAKSAEVKIGQTAIAMGTPFGLVGGPTVTVGIVSAINRSIQTEVSFMEQLIQTDAAINPGNSGGPLANSAGKVIGVNTAVIQFAQGIGFAIAIEPAIWVANQLIEHGEIVRPWIGISAVDLNPKIVAYYKLPVERGVLVTAVMRNSQAAVSEIQPGDIIVRLGAIDINNVRDLIKVMNAHDVGDVVDMDLVRGSQRLSGQTTLEKAPSAQLPPSQPAL
ncbi:MAG: S1C family serine protease [Halobacteriota archaeon]